MHNLTDNLATVFSGNRVTNIEHRVSQLGNLCSCVDQFSAHGLLNKKARAIPQARPIARREGFLWSVWRALWL